MQLKSTDSNQTKKTLQVSKAYLKIWNLGDKIKKKIDAEILKYQNTVTQKEDKGISNQASLLKDDLEFDREASVDKLQSIKVKLTPLEEEHKIKTNKRKWGWIMNFCIFKSL